MPLVLVSLRIDDHAVDYACGRADAYCLWELLRCFCEAHPTHDAAISVWLNGFLDPREGERMGSLNGASLHIRPAKFMPTEERVDDRVEVIGRLAFE